MGISRVVAGKGVEIVNNCYHWERGGLKFSVVASQRTGCVFDANYEWLHFTVFLLLYPGVNTGRAVIGIWMSAPCTQEATVAVYAPQGVGWHWNVQVQ